jgi:hypothetical protein
MSTAKEKVLAYFEEWNDKGENPANGCSIWRYITDWNIFINGYLGEVIKTQDMGLPGTFEAVARILKMDKPKAAEIQWREANEFHHVGEGYSVEKFAELGWAVYFGSDRIHDRSNFFTTLEAAKQACQDHKQGRLEELL